MLFTTNCIQDPKDYADKVFTSGNVSWPGLVHCKGRDFSAVIRKALELPGFAEDVPGKEVLTGFGRETLLGAAPAVLDAVAQGKLRHIFLVGGCDGARPGRNYYTELVEKIPADCLILTLACGKFRFFDKELGSLGDIPRLLDVGQCNDAYAAVRVALALADALKCGVNDLPLSLVLSWYEQKAVSILLTLLALGVKNIRLGPTLPAFVSPNILKVLVEQWNIPTKTSRRSWAKILLQGKAVTAVFPCVFGRRGCFPVRLFFLPLCPRGQSFHGGRAWTRKKGTAPPIPRACGMPCATARWAAGWTRGRPVLCWARAVWPRCGRAMSCSVKGTRYVMCPSSCPAR